MIKEFIKGWWWAIIAAPPVLWFISPVVYIVFWKVPVDTWAKLLGD